MLQEHTVKIPLQWNLWIVMLSFLVGMVGSYTTTYMLYMLDRAKERRQRIVWLLVACLTFGGGTVWSLHFTGMMALNIGHHTSYDPFITFDSFIVATTGAISAFTMKYINIFEVVRTPDVENPEDVPLLQISRGGGDGQESDVPFYKAIIPQDLWM